MKYLISVLALAALPACLGGDSGGGGGMDTTSAASLNASMGTLMNDVRTGGGSGLLELEYDTDVGRAAQDHVNDMLANGYTGTTIDEGLVTARDGPDTARDVYGVSWQDFVQMIALGQGADGTGTTESVFNQWTTTGSNGGSGATAGSTAGEFNGALSDSEFDIFGIARAGSGSDMRWMLIILDQP